MRDNGVVEQIVNLFHGIAKLLEVLPKRDQDRLLALLHDDEALRQASPMLRALASLAKWRASEHNLDQHHRRMREDAQLAKSVMSGKQRTRHMSKHRFRRGELIETILIECGGGATCARQPWNKVLERIREEHPGIMDDWAQDWNNGGPVKWTSKDTRDGAKKWLRKTYADFIAERERRARL